MKKVEKGIGKVRLLVTCSPKHIIFPMFLQFFHFFARKPLVFKTFFIVCNIWASWPGGYMVMMMVACPAWRPKCWQKWKMWKKTNGFLAKKWIFFEKRLKKNVFNNMQPKKHFFQRFYNFFHFLARNHWFFHFFSFFAKFGTSSVRIANLCAAPSRAQFWIWSCILYDL